MNTKELEKRVKQVAETALYQNKFVSCIDVLLGIGYLQDSPLQDWKKGNVKCLENVLQANLSKISSAMKFFRAWAQQKSLKPSETAYVAKTRGGKQKLQFSKGGNPDIERAYRTHYISPELSEKKQQKLKEKLDKPPELVVFQVSKDAECSKCQKEISKSGLLYKEKDDVFCMQCSGFGDLVFLPSGNALLTRRAKKYSDQCVVVVRFSRARKRYERQGLLIEEAAYNQAELECAD